MSTLPESSSPPELPKSKPAPVKDRFRFSKVFSRWWWVAAIFVAAVTYVVSQIPSWMDMDGPLYESTALVEIKPIVDVTCGPVSSSITPHMTRQFMNTQFEVIAAPATLELALKKNDLLYRLGGDEKEAIKRMQKSIRTSQRRGTDLIEISYRDQNAQLAQDGAMAVFQAFKDRRYELEMSMRKEQLKAIKIELQNKNDRVQELRKRLMDIAEKVGLIWVDDKNGGKLRGTIAGLRDQAEKELYEAEREMEQISFQINKLLSVDDGEQMLLLANMPEVGFKEAYQKYEDAVKEMDKMKAAGLSERHPDIQLRKARISELKKSLEKRAVNIRESLKHRLALIEGRVKKLKSIVNDIQDQGTKKARKIQEFNVARKEYQTALSIKDQMEVKYDIERTKMVLPPNNIIVHQTPEQAGVPVTRGRDFFVTLGTVCSLPFSIGLGILLMYIAELVFPRRT